MDGAINKVNDRYEVGFERSYQRPIEAVFAALTIPERLEAWLAAAQIEPRNGGAIVLNFADPRHEMRGEIRHFEPPTLFEFTWPEAGVATPSLVRFELARASSGCRLILTQTFIAPGDCPEVAAGWHEHLEHLAIATDGVSTTRWN